MADALSGPVARHTRINGVTSSWDEVTITFDAAGPDTKTVTFNATYFPKAFAALGTQNTVWLWVFRAQLTGGAGNVAPTFDNATRRVSTLDSSAAANDDWTSGGYEFTPLLFEVAANDTLTVGLGPSAGGISGTVTLGIGPSGVL